MSGDFICRAQTLSRVLHVEIAEGHILNLANFAIFLLVSWFWCLLTDLPRGRSFGTGWLHTAPGVMERNGV